ncbi:TIGR02281 family clan AA aspartic protease [soil metagenome]
MIRFDLQSTAVMAMATVSSLVAALWLGHAETRGRAEAAVLSTAPVVAHAEGQASRGQAPAGGQAAQVLKAADGHYWAEANIDGRAVHVLVDTGASVVALTREDALRLGLQLSPEDFDRTVQTAAGPARAAAVELASVSIAGAEVKAVDALVVEQGLAQSLLGMSYLGRLSAFEATPTGITLRP